MGSNNIKKYCIGELRWFIWAVSFWFITKYIFNGLGGPLSIWKIIHIILAGIYSIVLLYFLILMILAIISLFREAGAHSPDHLKDNLKLTVKDKKQKIKNGK